MSEKACHLSAQSADRKAERMTYGQDEVNLATWTVPIEVRTKNTLDKCASADRCHAFQRPIRDRFS
jgi:hypothetical protein